MDVIQTHDLAKSYGSRIGVAELSLRVGAGEIFGFLGPNGAGKTTTIRILLGLMRASSGSASILSHDCWRASHVLKQEVGYIPGDLRLYPWMTGATALWIVGNVRGRNLREPGNRLADQFQLDMNVSVRKMSRGMKQKLGLIMAMAHEPRLLILDEPTTALDPLMQYQLYQELRRRATAGATIFFSSHTLSEVEGLCDRVAIIREGRMVANATLAELRRRAPRQVVIDWPDDATAAEQQVPPILRLQERQRQRWQATLEGSPQDLLQWGASAPLQDITIGEPDLETLFRGYYSN